MNVIMKSFKKLYLVKQLDSNAIKPVFNIQVNKARAIKVQNQLKNNSDSNQYINFPSNGSSKDVTTRPIASQQSIAQSPQKETYFKTPQTSWGQMQEKKTPQEETKQETLNSSSNSSYNASHDLPQNNGQSFNVPPPPPPPSSNPSAVPRSPVRPNASVSNSQQNDFVSNRENVATNSNSATFDVPNRSQNQTSGPLFAANAPQNRTSVPVFATNVPSDAPNRSQNQASVPLFATNVPQNRTSVPVFATNVPSDAPNRSQNQASVPNFAANDSSAATHLSQNQASVPISNVSQNTSGPRNNEPTHASQIAVRPNHISEQHSRSNSSDQNMVTADTLQQSSHGQDSFQRLRNSTPNSQENNRINPFTGHDLSTVSTIPHRNRSQTNNVHKTLNTLRGFREQTSNPIHKPYLPSLDDSSLMEIDPPPLLDKHLGNTQLTSFDSSIRKKPAYDPAKPQNVHETETTGLSEQNVHVLPLNVTSDSERDPNRELFSKANTVPLQDNVNKHYIEHEAAMSNLSEANATDNSSHLNSFETNATQGDTRMNTSLDSSNANATHGDTHMTSLELSQKANTAPYSSVLSKLDSTVRSPKELLDQLRDQTVNESTQHVLNSSVNQSRDQILRLNKKQQEKDNQWNNVLQHNAYVPDPFRKSPKEQIELLKRQAARQSSFNARRFGVLPNISANTTSTPIQSTQIESDNPVNIEYDSRGQPTLNNTSISNNENTVIPAVQMSDDRAQSIMPNDQGTDIRDQTTVPIAHTAVQASDVRDQSTVPFGQEVDIRDQTTVPVGHSVDIRDQSTVPLVQTNNVYDQTTQPFEQTTDLRDKTTLPIDQSTTDTTLTRLANSNYDDTLHSSRTSDNDTTAIRLASDNDNTILSNSYGIAKSKPNVDNNDELQVLNKIKQLTQTKLGQKRKGSAMADSFFDITQGIEPPSKVNRRLSNIKQDDIKTLAELAELTYNKMRNK